MVFVLAEILGVSDRVGAEVAEVTPANFRQILVRARRDLYSFMHDRCGLVNESNPCRCARKTRGFIEKGYVNPRTLQFADDHLVQIRAATQARLHELDDLQRAHAELFRDHPLLAPPEEVLALRDLLDQAGLSGESSDLSS
jgi:hypothetical protein